MYIALIIDNGMWSDPSAIGPFPDAAQAARAAQAEGAILHGEDDDPHPDADVAVIVAVMPPPVYILTTQDPNTGQIIDQEVFDERPSFELLPGMSLRVANVNGGDSAYITPTP